MVKKDIFISYKNDGQGNNFAARIYADLRNAGYEVYFNPNEQHAGDFPERLTSAVKNCKDFLLILSQGCLEQLKRHEKVDWIREELLTAYNCKKNIIPLLLPGVKMPKDKEEMPEDLRFLPDKNAIIMSESYDKSPFSCLLNWILAQPVEDDYYRSTYNSSTKIDINKEYEKLSSLVDEENYSAIYELAIIYFYGLLGDEKGCNRDFSKAYNLLKILSESDDSLYTARANSMIAEMYYHGIVPRAKQSYSKSLEYHEKAKEISGFSNRESSYLKSRGCGCDFDYEETINSYKVAIENGDSVSVIGLAKFYDSYGKYHEAAELYKKYCESIPEAQYQLGMLYRDGKLSNPPCPDFFKAAYYFQHAIDSGWCNADVYHELGRLYFTPTGDFHKDFKSAEKNFLMASKLGSRSAQYKLGLMYEYGYVEKNIDKAIKYHKMAADKGSALSAYHLALLYQEPSNINYHKACKYAEIAAENGVMEGEFIYALFLLYGRGCIADQDKAYTYFLQAYNHGMLAAKVYLDKIE